MNKSKKLGFAGLGLMGLPMTLRLIEAGWQVTVWNRSREKILPALEAGATEASTPAELCQLSDIVLACVLDKRAMEEVVFGESGIAKSANEDKLLIDHSSVAPEATRDLALRLREETGMRWIDAPVSGGTKKAEDGKLVILAGGESGDIEVAQAVFAAYSEKVTHFGDVGTGQAAKLCNQVIAGTAMLTTVEALRLANDAGIDISKLPEAFKGGMADSLPFQLFAPRIVNKPDKPIGHLVSMLKDLESALDLATETGSPLPITTAAVNVYRKGVELGCGEKEPSALYDVYGASPEKF